MQDIKMSANDRNTQIAIAASNLVAAAANGDGTSVDWLIKEFDKVYDHILEKTRPIG